MASRAQIILFTLLVGFASVMGKIRFISSTWWTYHSNHSKIKMTWTIFCSHSYTHTGDYYGASEFSCIKCNSISDPNCLHHPEITSTCHSQSNECFMYVSPHSTFVLRGCVNGETESNDSPCCYEICSGWSNCNNRKIRWCENKSCLDAMWPEINWSDIEFLLCISRFI